MIKAIVLDFDGTIVTEDILDVISEIVGNRKESEQINQARQRGDLQGVEGIVRRINLLKGVNLYDIEKKIKENTYLMPGAKELLKFCKKQHIITILASGNIIPVLSFYQKFLGITAIVGSTPRMHKDIIQGIYKTDFPKKDFKVVGIKKILKEYQISLSQTLAIGDSPSDIDMFQLVGKSVAINPKNNINSKTDYYIKNNLSLVIPIINQINNPS